MSTHIDEDGNEWDGCDWPGEDNLVNPAEHDEWFIALMDRALEGRDA